MSKLVKLFGFLLIVIFLISSLHFFFGLRVELDGTGWYPMFSFYKPESHYAALVRSRAEQPTASTPAPVAAVVKTGLPVEIPAEAARETSTPAPESSVSAAAAPKITSLAYWTDFRGPRRDGRYEEMKVRTDWPSAGLSPLWKQPIGGGFASFVIADGLAFTIEQRRHREVVTAYAVETGRELWSYGWDEKFLEATGDGPRATPCWDDGYVYALGATGHFVCLEAKSGELVWSHNILADSQARNLTWGMSASPLVVDNKVIVLPGGPSGNSVVAYDQRTGRKLWSSLSDQQAYTSPMVVTLAGKRQLLVVSAERAIGLEVETGKLLWDHPWITHLGINSAQPVILGTDRFFISSGYGHGAAVVELAGNERAGFRTRTVWQNLNMKNKFNSSVLRKGFIYGLDEGILACVDAATGERKWKAGRYGYGQLLLADDRLIVLTESGDLVLVRATPEEHQELARFSAISGRTWNHPAIAGGRLLVRNATEMACFDVSP